MFNQLNKFSTELYSDDDDAAPINQWDWETIAIMPIESKRSI